MPYESPIIEPPVSQWPTDLASQADSAIHALRQPARKRLVDSAEQYVLRLSKAAHAAGLLSGDQPLLTGDPSATSIVMTGHQPVVFHSGLTFKYQTTEAFAVLNGLIAVAVVIDTDEGDAGAFFYPAAELPFGHLQIASRKTLPQFLAKTSTFAQRPGLFSASQLQPQDSISAELVSVEMNLRSCGIASAATAFHAIGQQYASLAKSTPAGFSTMEANLITRWNAGIGGRMLELPLSAICTFPEFIRFIVPIFERPFEFAQCYNQTLAEFRAEHRIRNEANPFPNLTIEDDWCELPFWVIDHSTGTRHLLQVRRESEGMSLECNRERLLTLEKSNTAEMLTSLLFAGQLLVPRGALITATLRLLFSDLFVHGTGGGKYDPCTDALIRSWWRTEPSPFAVASASLYLFPAERTRLIELQHVETQLRDMQYNPQRFLGTNVFPALLEERLTTLLQQKVAAVQRMQTARETGTSAKDIGREIQQITDEIKLAVSQEFEPQLVELRSLTETDIAVITSRTWPWFLFAEHVLV